jgi:molybdopterin converting factor small subunit
MITVTVVLFQHLREKIGKGDLTIEMPEGSTLKDLKNRIYGNYPELFPHLENILVLMGKRIIVDQDVIQDAATISFLTPIGGG